MKRKTKNNTAGKRKPDDYVLFKFKFDLATEDDCNLLDELFETDRMSSFSAYANPEYEIGIYRIQHGVYDKHGEWYDNMTSSASVFSDSLVKGSFKTLKEAELKLLIDGWKMVDVTSKYKRRGENEYLGRSVVKAYALSPLAK